MAGRVAGNRRPQRSELPRELLELILEKLDLADHARFASVCSSWRSVAVENPPVNKPLYFALSHDPMNLVRRFITSFIPSWRYATFIGAGLDGWLVILIDGGDLFLLNEAFNSIIPLPTPPKDPNYFLETPHYYYKAVLSSPPPLSSSSSSSGECTVAFKHYLEGVFYCRLGSDKSFAKLSNIPRRWVQDILFYKGRLYVLCFQDTNTITIFDHLLNMVTQLVAHFGDDPLRSYNPYRLLISENKLLITSVLSDPLCVFELDPSESRLTRVENIKDNLLLLLNSFCSLSISTNEHKGFQRTNSFYMNKICSTFVLGTSEGSNKAEVGDPWPLFFVMFSDSEDYMFDDECS